MSKVFMITEGLENMGALKTGGQGSVYKGKRVGDIITAVKILPTPIHSESAEDKNFVDFENEVEKLKRVNEIPNPNVVKILNSGITGTGSFPFIEMEFVEGPDLQELLNPPHDPVYSVKGAIKLAEQLANALAHCHKVEVKHGDIKSNNIKYNIHTANYVLLDFGMAVMSDEQRRTSLRHAGAIEFMAPEQNEGLMLYQTDVYSYGVVLFEILAGRVPFPLSDRGETARNHVMVSHMETPVPDLIELRRGSLPQHWESDRKRREMQVPHWLTDMIYKCLEKKPEDRFENGIALLEYIQLNNSLAARKEESNADYIRMLEQENERLLDERNRMQSGHLHQESDRKLKRSAAVAEPEGQYMSPEKAAPFATQPNRRSVPAVYFFALLFLTLTLGVFAAIRLLKNDNDNKLANSGTTVNTDTTSRLEQNDERFAESDGADDSEEIEEPNSPKTTLPKKEIPTNTSPQKKEQNNNSSRVDQQSEEKQTRSDKKDNTETSKGLGNYKLAGRKVYFHNSPDESTRRNAFIVHWNNATLIALDEKNDFIYVEFTNHLGQISKGWLPKKDLKPVE